MFKTRPLPKHLLISETLIREIGAGILTDGTRLPPEKIMAEQYGVAVGTLRKALLILEEKGLLKRVQGSGNYIQYKQAVDSIYSHFRLELIKGAGLPKAQIQDISLAQKPKDAPDFGPSPKAHRIVRLRSLGDIQIALEEIWLDHRFSKNLRLSDISESLYHFYKESFDLRISKIEDRLGASVIPKWTPEGFNMKAGEIAGYIERVSWDQFDRPAEFSKTWFNPDVARYVSRF